MKKRALNQYDQALYSLLAVGHVAMFVFFAYNYANKESINVSGITLFLCVFCLFGVIFCIRTLFTWVRIDEEKITYHGVILEPDYYWDDISDFDYPRGGGGFTPHVSVTMKNGKKDSIPCGDSEIRALFSKLAIDKIFSKNLSEQVSSYNSGQSLRD